MRTRSRLSNDALTFELADEYFNYDPETGLLRWKRDHLRKCCAGEVAGCKNNRGYVIVSFLGNCFRAHRLAWLLTYKEMPAANLIIDHINHIQDDNRICNLRLATPSENMYNVRLIPASPLGAKGVQKNLNGKRYKAMIRSDRSISKYLGTFDTLDEAAHAYNKAAIVMHGEFAVLNPIGSDK